MLLVIRALRRQVDPLQTEKENPEDSKEHDE
jgi:hypothetical protein